MKPIIGIAANQHYMNNAEFFDQPFTYTPQGFIAGIQQAGGLAMLLPIAPIETAAQYISQIDKLVLAGGQDISPCLYDEEPHPKLGPTSIERDLFEAALLKEALKQNKPILTVCRGTQLLNVTLGGNLYQDLSLYPDWRVKHDMFPTPPAFGLHSISLEATSTLAKIFGTKTQVNSFHHQAIKKLAPELTPVAWSTDAIIEAVENKAKRILGVQWHPELTHQTDQKEQALFDYFVQKL